MWSVDNPTEVTLFAKSYSPFLDKSLAGQLARGPASYGHVNAAVRGRALRTQEKSADPQPSAIIHQTRSH